MNRVATGLRWGVAGSVLATLTLLGCDKKTPPPAAAPPPPPAAPHSAASGQAAPAEPGVNVSAIKVNTVGYPAEWDKVAIFNIEPKNPVVETKRGEVAYEIPHGAILSRGVDPASKDAVWQVDFTPLEKPGRYRIRSGETTSELFEIGEVGYRRALLAAQKHFYFQRTRTALVKPYAEWEGDAYTRAKPSHVHDDVGWDLLDYPEKKRKWKLEGGWHDAGNYDMYVPSTAPTVQALLMAYEATPRAFADGDLNIPESGNGIPDVLDEAKWGLDWVLSMQEDATGAFRHREAVMEWTPEVPADQDTTVRWVAGPSTAATGKAVAALALAARIYAPFDQAYANRAEAAARAGWKYLLAHPEHIRVDGKGSKQPLWDDEPGRSDTGARFVAAVEMWRAFQAEGSIDTIRAAMDSPEATPAELLKGAWANLSRWALTGLAHDDKVPDDLREAARRRLVEAALILRSRVEDDDGYRCATGLDEYYWGHNSNLLEKAHILLVAAELTGEDWALEAARDQWHWILGRNPNGYSMVTRVGKGPDRIYHMEWGKSEPPPPGYLVGGPNAVEMKALSPNAPAKALLWDNPEPLRSGLPAHSLWHWQQSDLWDGGFVPDGQWTGGWWAVTEPDIYYNANLVLAAARLVSPADETAGNEPAKPSTLSVAKPRSEEASRAAPEVR